MRNCFKLIIILLCLFCFSSCKKDTEEIEIIEYLPYSPSKLESFDSYSHTVIDDNVKYKSTYFFENGESIALKMDVTFSNESDAQEFYEKKLDEHTTTHLGINKNVVTYYERYEHFDTYLYTKEGIKELVDFIEIE